jgi:NodT family efflux transporter outer membrane factor (OMF) lipoprotein
MPETISKGDESNLPIKPQELAFPVQSARRAKGVPMRRATLPDSARPAFVGRGTAVGGGRGAKTKVHWPLAPTVLGLVLLMSGCTPLEEFIHNGFKVGPNYQRPPAPLAPAWIDAANPQVKSLPADYSAWWTVFHDPVLDDLVRTAYAQNVNLRVAGTRVLEARAQRAIAVGTLFPQKQTATGAFTHTQVSSNIANVPPNPVFDDWATGFNASWEIDFWGRIRRTIESTDDLVESSVDDYDSVMVTLIGDLATAYVQYRILEQQIVYTQENVRIQRDSLRIASARWRAGQTSQLGVAQASSLLEQIEATIPVLESGLRVANNQLCVLLGTPPTELAAKLGPRDPIVPQSPPEVIVGIPADLIRRRPDLRSAERLIAAQNAQIGVAEADWYPTFFINGTFGYEARDLAKLFESKSFTGQIGPAFQWNILNYGRILNNVRLQDFKTQELVAGYQQKVLAAAQEVENGIVSFLNSQREAGSLAASAKDAALALKLATDNFQAGTIDYTPVFVAEQFLVQQQNAYAQAQGDIALGLIQVYRALGGGWELRLAEQAVHGGTVPAVSLPAPEVAPPPRQLPPAARSPSPAGGMAGQARGIVRMEETRQPADPAVRLRVPVRLLPPTEDGVP